jgi:Flp pilus assembly protein TadG
MRRRPRSRGATIEEFAVVAALLMMLLYGSFEGARLILVYNGVSQGAREGARYAMTHPSDTAGIVGTAKAQLGGVDPSQVTVSIATGTALLPSGNPVNTIKVTVSTPYVPIVAFSPVTLSASSTANQEPGCPPSPIPISTFC